MKVTISGSIESDISCQGLTFCEWVEAKKNAVFSIIESALPESFKGENGSFENKMVKAILKETESEYEVQIDPIGTNPLALVNAENARKILIRKINESMTGLLVQ